MDNFIDSREAQNFEREYLELITNLGNLIKNYSPKQKSLEQSINFLSKFINLFKDLGKNRYNALNDHPGEIKDYSLKINLDGECIFYSSNVGEKKELKFTNPEKAPEYASRLASAFTSPESMKGSLSISLGNKEILKIRNGELVTDAFNLIPALQKELGLNKSIPQSTEVELPKIEQLLNAIDSQNKTIDNLNKTVKELQEQYKKLEALTSGRGISTVFDRLKKSITSVWDNIKLELEERRLSRIKHQVLTSGYKDYRNLENLFKAIANQNNPVVLGNSGFFSSYDPNTGEIVLKKIKDLEPQLNSDNNIVLQAEAHTNDLDSNFDIQSSTKLGSDDDEADFFEALSDLFENHDPPQELSSRGILNERIDLNKQKSSVEEYDRLLDKQHLKKIQNILSYLGKNQDDRVEFKNKSYYINYDRNTRKCDVQDLQTSEFLVKNSQVRSNRLLPTEFTTFLDKSNNYKPVDLQARLEKLFLKSTKVTIDSVGKEIYESNRYTITRDPQQLKSLQIKDKNHDRYLMQNGLWNRDLSKTSIDNFFRFLDNCETKLGLNSKDRSLQVAQNIAQTQSKKKGRKI